MKPALRNQPSIAIFACLIVGVAVLVVIALRFAGVGIGEWSKAITSDSSVSRYDRYIGGGVFNGGGPCVSPDGRHIVFSSARTGQGDIYRIDTDGGQLVALTHNPACEVEPRVSPDGTLIAYVRETKNVGHIWIMKADGTSERQLTFGPREDSGPLFTLDGKYVLFTRETGDERQSECCSIRSDGSHLVHRKTEPFDTETASIWGTRICSDDDVEGMVVIGIDGSGRRVIGKGSSPVFSPDGRWIAFLDDPYNQTIWTMSQDGTNRRQILNSRTAKSHPAISADGKYIFFIEDSNQGSLISRVKTDGSDYRRLFNR